MAGTVVPTQTSHTAASEAGTVAGTVVPTQTSNTAASETGTVASTAAGEVASTIESGQSTHPPRMRCYNLTA